MTQGVHKTYLQLKYMVAVASEHHSFRSHVLISLLVIQFLKKSHRYCPAFNHVHSSAFHCSAYKLNLLKALFASCVLSRSLIATGRLLQSSPISMAGYRDQPFSLDVAFERHDIKSQSALFQLPFEILSSIIELLPEESFDKFSTINSDFYLIARSRQFATIDFRYSQRTLLLIQRLISETPGYESTLPKLPSFGHCVRNASAAVIRSRQMIKFDRQNWDDIPLDPEEFDRFEARAFNFEDQMQAFHGYVGALIQLVLIRLENFLWSPATHFKLNQNFLDSLLNSSIKSLSFGEFLLEDELLEDDDKLLLTKSHNLVRLQLGLGAVTSTASDAQQMYSFLLAHLGSTIRRLDLHLSKISASRMSITSKVELPLLEELRLAMHNPGVVGTSFLQVLLPAGPQCHIHSLYVSLNRDTLAKEFFKKRGQIPSLKSLVWDDDDEQTSMAVLSANPQLRKVNIAPGLGSYLPILASNFDQLTTLSVVLLNSTSMVRSTFETIGRILSLENLNLGLEEHASDFSQRYWIADHNTVRDCFGRLRNLRMLSFGFDIYHLHSLLPWHRYYADMILIAQIQVLLDFHSVLPTIDAFPAPEAVSIVGADVPTNVNPSQWEREHKERMLLAAKTYFHQHPSLNFLYLGQLVIRREIWSGAVTCSPSRGRAPNRLASVFRFAE
jgi:hypothetical protein